MAHVLLVDDDFLQLELVKTMLERAGHKVSLCHNGREGLSRLSQDLPDVVVTDVFMPVRSGILFIAAVREYHGELPIIAMTGGLSGIMTPYIDMLTDIEIDQILCKPFTETELLATLGRVLDDLNRAPRASSTEPQWVQ